MLRLKNELQNIIQSNDSDSKGDLIKTVQAYLKTNTEASVVLKEGKQSRAEEERSLISYVNEKRLLYKPEKWGTYITEGAEQRVFFPGNTDYVIKVSDAIFYQFWVDYFNSLLIHNRLFPTTTYELLGFHIEKEKLFAVLRQPFIATNEITQLEVVKEFLLANGFTHKKITTTIMII